MFIDDIESRLTELVRDKIAEALGDKAVAGLGEICADFPDNPDHGDFSFNVALRLGRIAKRTPRAVAEELKKIIAPRIAAEPFGEIIEKLEVAGPGFLNFFIRGKYYFLRIKEILSRGDRFGARDVGRGEKAQIEFVSANPTGPLSIAHARQAAVGDSLARIMRFCGFDVTREYYLNDKGRQIDILGRSIEARLKQLQGEDANFPDEYYQGDYIRDIAAKIRDSGPEGKRDFSRYGIEYILEGIKRDLADFGVCFDNFFSQEKLEAGGAVEEAIAALRAQGLVADKDGALWFKSSLFGDDKDRVVVKGDKSYTYLAPDIAYHRDKFRRGFRRVIDIWGPDHHGYIPRIKAAVAALGRDKDALRVIIVQLVKLLRGGKAVPMSTRRGSYVTLRQLIDEVGKDATRFFLVARRTPSQLDFDLELAKKQSAENPVYYIQYGFARVRSIMRKRDDTGIRGDWSDDLAGELNRREELALIRKLSEFPRVLGLCLVSLDPYPLSAYLQGLAGRWHKFYDTHKVLDEKNQRLSRARLGLAEACGVVLKNGLTLLGLSAPEKM
ncbi:MAG: arginine--tRNA ligase [Candidatus Omnitrophota bacterium]